MQETVTENMTPEADHLLFSQAADIFKQFLVVAYMFKHFHRNHAVKGRGFQLQHIDVAGDHRQVLQFF